LLTTTTTAGSPAAATSCRVGRGRGSPRWSPADLDRLLGVADVEPSAPSGKQPLFSPCKHAHQRLTDADRHARREGDDLHVVDVLLAVEKVERSLRQAHRDRAAAGRDPGDLGLRGDRAGGRRKHGTRRTGEQSPPAEPAALFRGFRSVAVRRIWIFGDHRHASPHWLNEYRTWRRTGLKASPRIGSRALVGPPYQTCQRPHNTPVPESGKGRFW